VRNSLRAFGTPLVIDGPCDTKYYDYADATLTPWFDRDDALSHIQRRCLKQTINEQESKWLTEFVSNGFIVADDLVEPELIDQIGLELQDAVAKNVNGYEYGSSDRINNLHLVYPGIRKLWAHPKILKLLEVIFESKPRPCQTLAFIFGSQQDAHQDTIHLTPFPAGYMCGVWIAIDDVQPDFGELVVYRGSHRTPRVYTKETGCPKFVNSEWTQFGKVVVPIWRRLVETGSFQRIVYRPKRGTVLIWHENLLHGGSVRKDASLPRRSIVSHIFADGGLAFYDSTGMVGAMEPLENLSLN
jgi:hypothetical protein